MADTLSCPECGEEIDSAEQLEEGSELREVAKGSDGSIRLYENRDLFLCKNCKKPLGVSRS